MQPQEHLRRALLLPLAGGPSSVAVPDVVVRAIDVYSSGSVAELVDRCRQAIRYWSAKVELLPRRDDEPFQSALVEAMDKEQDLFNKGPWRGDIPLEPVQVAMYGAAVTGVVAYDRVFSRRANPGRAPVPLDTLFSLQEGVHTSVLAKDLRAGAEDGLLLWKALRKEVTQGFGAVHLDRPSLSDIPDVFYPHFIAQ